MKSLASFSTAKSKMACSTFSKNFFIIKYSCYGVPHLFIVKLVFLNHIAKVLLLLDTCKLLIVFLYGLNFLYI